MGVNVREIERPASRLPRHQPVGAGQHEGQPGDRFQAFVGGEHHGVDLRLCREIERQRAERGDRVEQQSPPGASHDRADRARIVDHARASLAVDEPDMADRRVRRQRRRDRLGVDPGAERQRQGHHDPPGLAREPDHPIGVGAGHRHQQLAASGEKAADHRLHREMAAALQRQGGVRLRVPAGDRQHALAQAGVERAEIVVPGGEVMRQRGADLGAGDDGAGDQQEHPSQLTRPGARIQQR